MIKVYSRRPDDVHFAYIVTSATVLLDRLKSGRLPALCRGKCLAVLMQSMWLEPSQTAAVAIGTFTAAESTLIMLYSLDDGSLVDMSLLSICHLLVDKVDNHHTSLSSATVRTAGVEIQATSQPSSTLNPHCVTVTTIINTSAASENIQNRRSSLTSSQGLCAGLQTRPAAYSACAVGPVPAEFCDSQAVSFDAKLVRKFVLLVLRCLDIVTRETADQSKLVYPCLLCD